MTAPIIPRIAAIEDTDVAYLARIQTIAGANITIAAISTITYAVFDLDAVGQGSVASGSVTVASAVYDTLQTGSGWTEDDDGFNFRFVIPYTAFPSPDRQYQVEFTFTPTSGNPFKSLLQVTTFGVQAT